MALLRTIAHEQGASVVLVTHDREAAALADRDYMLRDGRLSPARGHDEDSGTGTGTGTETDPDAGAYPLPVS